MCRVEKESTVHLLFRCNFTGVISWLVSPLQLRSNALQLATCKDTSLYKIGICNIYSHVENTEIAEIDKRFLHQIQPLSNTREDLWGKQAISIPLLTWFTEAIWLLIIIMEGMTEGLI